MCKSKRFLFFTPTVWLFIFSFILGRADVAQCAVDGPSKTVNISFSQNLGGNLDPHNATTITAVNTAAAIFDVLVQEDREGNYFPRLAERWESNETGERWRFFLRKGVKFHNGEPFDAQDVKCTFDRLLANKTNLRSATTYWTSLLRCDVVDDYTVDLVFNAPSPRCLINAASTPIIPNEAFTEYGDELWAKQMIYGTGPWIFKEWVEGQYLRLAKNQDYWNKAEYDPYYEEVYLRIIMEPSTVVAAHLAGDVQLNAPTGGVTKELKTLYEGSENRIQKIERNTGQVYYLHFQCADGKVFHDKNTRMAFEYCLDRKSILDYVLDGDGELVSSFIPGPVWGFDPALEPYEYNTEKAKEYLAKSDYDGRKITLLTHNAVKKGEEVLLAVADNMKAVGFDVNIEIVDLALSYERRTTGNYDLLFIMAQHSNNDATEMLMQRILSNSQGHNYVNPEMNDLIQKLEREMDAAQRAAYVTRISHIMREEAAPATAIASANMTYYADWGVTGVYYFRDGGVRTMYVDYDPSLVPK